MGQENKIFKFLDGVERQRDKTKMGLDWVFPLADHIFPPKFILKNYSNKKENVNNLFYLNYVLFFPRKLRIFYQEKKKKGKKMGKLLKNEKKRKKEKKGWRCVNFFFFFWNRKNNVVLNTL